ncbi:MAG: sodium/proline symporter PutP [Pseudomonadota bacterium]|nr:MAG: sodium/proline symporter PutP [Pseudomonadota bacterium]
MQADQALIALTFVVYIATMLAIGAVAWRRTRNLADYILGGRTLGRWVTAISAGASDMSGWLLLGLPGYAYAAGFEAGWIALGLLIGTWLNWRLVAARLRRYSELAGDSLTLPEFFEQRFHDTSHVLRVVSALFILLFFLFYTSSGLVAGGKLFNAVFDLPYQWAVAVGALTILVYTFLGGFLAVSWTDLFQGLLMALALLLVPVLAILALGGAGATLDGMRTINPALLDPFSDAQGKVLSVLAVASLLGWGLGYFGQPHILARFAAIRTPGKVPAARRIAMSWVTLCMGGALLTGFAGVGFLTEPLHGPDTEKVFIMLVNALLHPVVAGMCLAGILAAIMSTADSQLLVSASALTEDFYKALLRRDASESELVWIGRGAVLALAVVALALAWDPDRKVLDLVAWAWAGFGAAFGPTLLLALFWRRMNRYGALAGIVTGGLTVVIWEQLASGLFDLYELVPGFALSLLAGTLVSLATPPPPDTVTAQFDEAIDAGTT